MKIGIYEGDDCNRDYDDGIGPCQGTMIFEPEDCYCHTHPPCGLCLDGMTCTVCGVRGVGGGA